MNGYIKLHRKLISWEWYTDQNTFKLFIHCLLMANHKPNKWRGIVIDTGEFVTSLEKLSVDTGMTIRQVRTSLQKLVSTEEIEKKTTSQFTQIKVLKYCDYQTSEIENDKQNVTQTTNKRQTNDKQTTTNKNDKNIKNDKKKEYIGDFATFWSHYPKKVNKPLSIRSFEKMVKNKETFDLIMADLEKRKGYDQWVKEDGKYIPNPSSYLNGQRWLDEYDITGGDKRQDIMPDWFNNKKEGLTDYEEID